MTKLASFNNESEPVAIDHLQSLCGSRLWAQTLAAQRPYKTVNDLRDAAQILWFSLDEPEWQAAFACHPRIGETKSPAAATGDFAASSISEQSTAQATLAGVAQALTAANRAYEQKFGFLYIIFANGRTAPELLELLQARLLNDRPAELLEAARQQWLITELRMTRYFQA